jgi:hypothetical protein
VLKCSAFNADFPLDIYFKLPIKMIVGRCIVRMKNAAIKNYNIQMELVKTFKKDWKEMQDASAPMPDPPDYEPPVMTIKK